MRKILPFLAIGAAAVYFYTQLQNFKAGLKARLGIIKFNLKDTSNTGFFRLVVDVQVIISNPSKVQAKITGGDIKVFLKDKLIANITQLGSYAINAGTESTIPVKLAIPTLSIVDSIATLIRNLGTGVKQTLTVAGEIQTNVGTVTINENINFTI